jgi:hypothetical protein
MTMDYKMNLYKAEPGRMVIEIRNPETGKVRQRFKMPVMQGEIYRIEIYGDVHEN